MEEKVFILYRWKPYEVNIGSYSTAILKLLSNMILQFVRGVYAMLRYLISYLCKPENAMSELMRMASKEAYGKVKCILFDRNRTRTHKHLFCKRDFNHLAKLAYRVWIHIKMRTWHDRYIQSCILRTKFLLMKQSKEYHLYLRGIQIEMFCMFLTF